MRLLAVECCGPLAKLCEQEDITSHILPVVKKFAQVLTVILHADPSDFRPSDQFNQYLVLLLRKLAAIERD